MTLPINLKFHVYKFKALDHGHICTSAHKMLVKSMALNYWTIRNENKIYNNGMQTPGATNSSSDVKIVFHKKHRLK